MKRLVFTLCVLGFCGTASGQGYWWESDETKALRAIDDRLEQLDWDMRMSWTPSSGGYYPMYYPEYPRITPRMAQEAARRANWAQRGQAKRAALAARRAKQVGK